MGHTRLGDIPKTKKWDEVVSTVATMTETGDTLLPEIVKAVAEKTIEATQAGLERVINDYGFRYSFYLLTQIALSSKDEDWPKRLEKFGIYLGEDSNIFDLVSDIHNSIDEFLLKYGKHTDISEKAQQAAGEALTKLVGPESKSLFDLGREDLLVAIKKYSTKKGFARLAQKFFSSFLSRYLNFYLSRITASLTGQKSIPQVGDLSRFNMILIAHCEQSAMIVHDFSGEWYSKTEHLEGITLENTSKFLAVALRKLQTELESQKEQI